MVLLSSYHLCSGQNPAIDSLKLVLANAREDTSKVNILIAICQNVYRSLPEDAISYGNEAKILSEKLDYQPGLANSCKYIGIGYYIQGNYGEAVNFWQQSLTSFEAVKDKVGVAFKSAGVAGIINLLFMFKVFVEKFPYIKGVAVSEL